MGISPTVPAFSGELLEIEMTTDRELRSLVSRALDVPQEHRKLFTELARMMSGTDSDKWGDLLQAVYDAGVPVEPLPFYKNKHGHYVVPLVGQSLTGEESIATLKKQGVKFDEDAEGMLLSDEYTVSHRLADKSYRAVLVPLRHFPNFSFSTENMLAYGASLGYEGCLAGTMPRLRELIDDRTMERMGFWQFAGFHTPIISRPASFLPWPRVFTCNRGQFGPVLGTVGGYQYDQWGLGGTAAVFHLL